MTGTHSEDHRSSVSRRAAVIVNPVKAEVAHLRSAVALEEKNNGWLPSVWFETTVADPGQVAARAALVHDPGVAIASKARTRQPSSSGSFELVVKRAKVIRL